VNASMNIAILCMIFLRIGIFSSGFSVFTQALSGKAQ
jgi:hypothetical protein